MKTFILIIYVFGTHGAAISSMEISNKNKCEQAAQEIQKQWPSGLYYRPVTTICIEK